jgi:hypothetical protein
MADAIMMVVQAHGSGSPKPQRKAAPQRSQD